MFARFVLLVGFTISVGIAGTAQQQPQEQTPSQAELNAGVQAFRQANYDAAIDHFEKAVSLDPEFTLARLYLATTYAQTFVPGVDNPDNVVRATNALNQYSEILRRHPSDIESIKGMAYLYWKLKSFEQARESYKQAIALDPTDPEMFYSAGVADWSIASHDLTAEKAKQDPESQDAETLAATCTNSRAIALANIDDGIALLTKAASLRKDYADAMSYLNLLYRMRADIECADQDAQAADLKKAGEWSEQAKAAKKKKAEAALPKPN
ncbi:MAG TPA: tetratricopeptide repeat protein [Candidatus Angelobacter sp.]|jgi:tetratricopeptide (TPR) repeat protein